LNSGPLWFTCGFRITARSPAPPARVSRSDRPITPPQYRSSSARAEACSRRHWRAAPTGAMGPIAAPPAQRSEVACAGAKSPGIGPRGPNSPARTAGPPRASSGPRVRPAAAAIIDGDPLRRYCGNPPAAVRLPSIQGARQPEHRLAPAQAATSAQTRAGVPPGPAGKRSRCARFLPTCCGLGAEARSASGSASAAATRRNRPGPPRCAAGKHRRRAAPRRPVSSRRWRRGFPRAGESTIRTLPAGISVPPARAPAPRSRAMPWSGPASAPKRRSR